jgi:hydroxymethylbilane synthase
MRRLGAGCFLPVAAYGEVAGETLTLRGLVISLDGQRQVQVQQSIGWTTEDTLEDAELLGVKVAEQALEQGAHDIIDSLLSMSEQEHLHV